MNIEDKKPSLFSIGWHRKSDGFGMKVQFPRTWALLDSMRQQLPEMEWLDHDEKVMKILGSSAHMVFSATRTMLDIHSGGLLKAAGNFAREQGLRPYFSHYMGKKKADRFMDVTDAMREPGDFLVEQLKDRVSTAAQISIESVALELSDRINERDGKKSVAWHERFGYAIRPDSPLAKSGYAEDRHLGYVDRGPDGRAQTYHYDAEMADREARAGKIEGKDIEASQLKPSPLARALEDVRALASQMSEEDIADLEVFMRSGERMVPIDELLSDLEAEPFDELPVPEDPFGGDSDPDLAADSGPDDPKPF